MRKLLTILIFIFTSQLLKAQFPFTQSMGTTSTLVKVRGGIGADSVYVLVNQFTDTATANLGYLKGIAGALIRTTGDTIWMRNNAASAWNQVNGGGGGGAGTVTNVSFTGGLISVANPTTTPALTVAGTSGGIPYFSSTSTWASSALLAANSLMIGGGAGAWR